MIDLFANAISTVESGGNYGAIGPVTRKGNRAYGRYQVMDFNIGPWTEKYLGRRLTPDEFLASPEAQDAVFQGEFGSYVDRYGNPQDAASVWFSGRPMSAAGNASDGYNTVPEYVAKFNNALGGQPMGLLSMSTSGMPEQPKPTFWDKLGEIGPMLMMMDPSTRDAGVAFAEMNAVKAGKAEQKAASNRTIEWLRSQAAQYPQLAPLLGAAESGSVDMGTVVNTAFQVIQEASRAPDPWANTKVVGDSIIAPDGQGGFAPVYSAQPVADPQSAIAKLAADLRAGLITQDQYDLAVANMAPPGMSIESDGQGGFRMVQGPGVNGTARPFTEAQSKDNVYATRAKGALEVLDPLAETLTSRGEQIVENIPLGFGREWQTQAFQVAKQAGDEFLQAILRKDTGAAITAQEQALYGTTYLPQPGDGPAVLEAKKAARQRAIAAIEAGMSPAQIVATEQAIVEAAKRSGAPTQTMTDDDLLRKYGLQP